MLSCPGAHPGIRSLTGAERQHVLGKARPRRRLHILQAYNSFCSQACCNIHVSSFHPMVAVSLWWVRIPRRCAPAEMWNVLPSWKSFSFLSNLTQFKDKAQQSLLNFGQATWAIPDYDQRATFSDKSVLDSGMTGYRWPWNGKRLWTQRAKHAKPVLKRNRCAGGWDLKAHNMTDEFNSFQSKKCAFSDLKALNPLLLTPTPESPKLQIGRTSAGTSSQALIKFAKTSHNYSS